MKGSPYLRPAGRGISRRFASNDRDGWKIFYYSFRECCGGYDRIDTGACGIGPAARGDFSDHDNCCSRPPPVPGWFHDAHPLLPHGTPRMRLYLHEPTPQTPRCRSTGCFWSCPSCGNPCTLAGCRHRASRCKTRSSGRSGQPG